MSTEEEIKANTPTTLKAEVSGGLEPYTYKFTVKVDGEWITIANPDNQSEVSYTFAEPGIYSVCAAVTDANRTTSKSQKKITVKSDEPLKADLIPEENIKAGTPTVFKAEVSGGLEPYTYKYNYVTTPITVIDEQVIWFGEPLSSADFLSGGNPILTEHFPCLRFVGKHTARLLRAVFEIPNMNKGDVRHGKIGKETDPGGAGDT